jgi:hypothetical protein
MCLFLAKRNFFWIIRNRVIAKVVSVGPPCIVKRGGCKGFESAHGHNILST